MSEEAKDVKAPAAPQVIKIDWNRVRATAILESLTSIQWGVTAFFASLGVAIVIKMFHFIK